MGSELVCDSCEKVEKCKNLSIASSVKGQSNSVMKWKGMDQIWQLLQPNAAVLIFPKKAALITNLFGSLSSDKNVWLFLVLAGPFSSLFLTWMCELDEPLFRVWRYPLDSKQFRIPIRVSLRRPRWTGTPLMILRTIRWEHWFGTAFRLPSEHGRAVYQFHISTHSKVTCSLYAVWKHVLHIQGATR